MGKRRKAREIALKILYLVDTCDLSLEEAKNLFSSMSSDSKDEFTSILADGVVSNLKEIDSLIAKYAENWEIGRMASVDRNIIRQGVFEFLQLREIPVKVVINEAVELAKKYSTEDSGKFVNGILDKIKDNLIL